MRLGGLLAELRHRGVLKVAAAYRVTGAARGLRPGRGRHRRHQRGYPDRDAARPARPAAERNRWRDDMTQQMFRQLVRKLLNLDKQTDESH